METGKAEAREKAIRAQEYLSTHAVSYEELAEIQTIFECLSKRFGLEQEFKENGLI